MKLSLGLSLCAPSGSWSLASIGSLAFLYDAAQIAAGDLNGSKVVTWRDRSGNANDVTQGTDANRPTLVAANPHFKNLPSVNFSKAAATYLAGSSLPICTAMSGSDKPLSAIAVVRRSTKVSADEALWSLGNSGAGTPYLWAQWRYASSNSQRWRCALSDGTETAAQGLNETTDHAPQILAVTYDGAANLKTFVVGATQNPRYDATVAEALADASARGSMTFNRFGLGAFVRNTTSNQPDCEVALIAGFTKALSPADLAQACAFLWAKYIAVGAGDLSLGALAGVAHWWDANGVDEAIGEACATLYDGTGGKHFTAAGSARPLVVDDGAGGKALRFDGVDDVMTAGAAADWPLLHNAANKTVLACYRTVEPNRNALEPILDTLDNAPATKNGLGVYHDNIGANKHQLLAKIGAANATPVLNRATQVFGAMPGEWHVAAIRFEATVPSSDENFQLWLDNENFCVEDQGLAPAAGDPSHPLTLGKLAATNTFAKIEVRLIAVWNVPIGRPTTMQAAMEYLAKLFPTAHVALGAGNGLAQILDDATMHRGFPGLLLTAVGTWLLSYRRATTHGASAGVAALCTSGDRVRWSSERVIFDDSANFDWRGVNCLVQISTGRIFLGMKLSQTDSTLLPYTAGVLKSDDGGSSWQGPQFLSHDSDAWLDGIFSGTGLTYDEGVNSIVELGDGSLLAHFMAQVNGAVYTHLVQCRSFDGGDTWTEPVPIFYGRSVANGGDFPVDERIQEPCVVRFADGELLMAIRADTPNEKIYFVRSSDNGETWTPEQPSTSDRIAGWGNPRMILDENERVYIFYRLAGGNAPVSSYSDERGAAGSFSAARPMSNLTTAGVTTIQGYTGMTYCYPAHDERGNIIVAIGQERAPDSDPFVKLWRARRPTKAVQLAVASNQYLTRSHEAAWSLVGAAGFTACGWLYRDSGGTAYFASKWAGAGARQWLLYCGATDFLTARLSPDGTNATVFTSTFDVSATGLWRFVALRWNPADVGAELAVFLDGQAKQTTAHAGGIATGGAALRLGASDLSLADSHDGRLHRWGFWSRALSDAEIADVRRGGRGYDWPDLPASLKAGAIAYYHLGQATSTRSDASGNGQHLAPVNAPTQAEGVEI